MVRVFQGGLATLALEESVHNNARCKKLTLQISLYLVLLGKYESIQLIAHGFVYV
jgi:hypothetical protein